MGEVFFWVYVDVRVFGDVDVFVDDGLLDYGVVFDFDVV